VRIETPIGVERGRVVQPDADMVADWRAGSLGLAFVAPLRAGFVDLVRGRHSRPAGARPIDVDVYMFSANSAFWPHRGSSSTPTPP